MAQAKTIGSGWHQQSVRHSNARRFGRAGGKYLSVRVVRADNRLEAQKKVVAQDFDEGDILSDKILTQKELLETLKTSGSRKFGYASYGQKQFKLPNGMTINAHAERTRNGFRHMVELYDQNGNLVETAKATYSNRTWESYEYETAIRDLLKKSNLPKVEQDKALATFEGKSKEEVDKMFGSLAMVASLGEVFGKTKKEKNDWRARMLRAGLENKGLEMPDDWDKLNEDEKEKRLNAVIGHLKESRKMGRVKDKEELEKLKLKRVALGVGTFGVTEAIHAFEPKYKKKDFTKNDLKAIKKFYTPFQRYYIFGLKPEDFTKRGL